MGRLSTPRIPLPKSKQPEQDCTSRESGRRMREEQDSRQRQQPTLLARRGLRKVLQPSQMAPHGSNLRIACWDASRRGSTRSPPQPPGTTWRTRMIGTASKQPQASRRAARGRHPWRDRPRLCPMGTGAWRHSSVSARFVYPQTCMRDTESMWQRMQRNY